jgi:hypothetical protein
MGLDDIALFRAVRLLGSWRESTLSCSAESHFLLYGTVAIQLLIVVGGVYVWRRFIRTKPKSDAAVVSANLAEVVRRYM